MLVVEQSLNGMFLADYGVLLADYGVFIADYGMFLADYGMFVADYGALLADYGMFLSDYGVFQCFSFFLLFVPSLHDRNQLPPSQDVYLEDTTNLYSREAW